MTTDPARVKRTDVGEPELSPVFPTSQVSLRKKQDEVAEGSGLPASAALTARRSLSGNLQTSLIRSGQRGKRCSTSRAVACNCEKGNEEARTVAQETMQFVRKPWVY